VGIGSVFSKEFYNLAANRLKTGGIMTQWFHLYEMDDDTMNLVLRTFASVYPYMEIWDVGDRDIVILGSRQPWKTGPEIYQKAFDLPQPNNDLTGIGLLSPRTVLARQLASQKTAFAIPGPGPVQSDDAPILEYDAPKAFYLSSGATSFENYDERTWQIGLAPLEKNKILAALSLDDLAPLFGKSYGSGNPQLESFLDNRFQGHVGLMAFGNQIMQCIFQDTNANLIVYAPPSLVSNLLTRPLYFDEIELLRNRSGNDLNEKLVAVKSIQNILNVLQGYQPQNSDWSAAHYVDIAVKECLRQGNIELARTILSRGLQLEPDSDQLAYLSRMLARADH
jgi:hypothetical protein